MAAHGDGGFELVLSNRQLLSLFFVVVVFFAAFFAFGYFVGFGHGGSARPSPQLAEAPLPAPTQEEVRLPDALLTPEPQAETPATRPSPASQPATPAQSPTQAPAATPPTPEPVQATPPSRPATATATADSSRGYNIQVSALRVPADAEMLANRLRERGYPVHISDNQGDGWHRIMVGPFASQEAAEESRGRLNRDGFETVLRAP